VQHFLERLAVTMRRPEFQLGVARRLEPDYVLVALRDDVERGHNLGVAPIETFGQAQHRRQRSHGAAQPALQHRVSLVRFLGRRLTMIACEQSNNLDFLWIEAAELAVLDQVIRMPVVPFVADVDAGVVQQRSVFEPLAFTVAQSVHRSCLVENGQCQLRNVARMCRVVPAPLPELDNTAPADVRVTLDLADRRRVAMDVVEDQPFTERQITQRDVVGAQASQHAVQQH